jgi:hypothetical protein
MNNAQILGQLPATLRTELLDAFNEIVKNYRENKWEPSELNGGKLCEVIYSILKGHICGSYPARSSKPNNMVDACKQLEQGTLGFPRSIRIQIPRVLTALYEVRNNRGVGHVGGEVNPNHMDATMVLHMSKWLMSELVRIFHSVDTKTATEAVELLTEREIPLIWLVNGRKRVLKKDLSMRNKTLLLLYSEPGSVSESVLVGWTEHSNPAIFRRDILVKGHKDRLWEYDKISKEVTLSPLGSTYVEQKLLIG